MKSIEIGAGYHCGLLGGKLGHSFSPLIHSRLADYEYLLYERTAEEVPDFLRSGGCNGLNVTIPYKKTAFSICDELSPIAQKTGSVNTIVRLPDGRLKGYNTDYFGFSYLVHKAGFDVSAGKILVLGSGGASVTVCAVLKDLGAKEVVVISRSGPNDYDTIYTLHKDARYLVNTTPVGMYPNTGAAPVDLSRFPDCAGVIDLIYNPARTKLLLDAERAGAAAVNGLSMLVAQAKQSCELFTGRPISDSTIEEIAGEIEALTKNIILIGMPGCGKSTVGANLAHVLNRPFVDIDDVIESRIAMTICDFFKAYGEKAFRKIETEVLAEYAKESGQIIATGGGIVTIPENLPLMRQNGTIVLLNRPLHELPVAGRPISMSCDLVRLEQERLPLYQSWKDVSVKSGNPEETTRSIISLLLPQQQASKG